MQELEAKYVADEAGLKDWETNPREGTEASREKEKRRGIHESFNWISNQ